MPYDWGGNMPVKMFDNAFSKVRRYTAFGKSESPASVLINNCKSYDQPY